MFEKDLRHNYEIIQGPNLVDTVANIYHELPPSLAAQIINPNVVMAIAGLKGIADIPWVELSAEEIERMKQLRVNSYSANHGILFLPRGDSITSIQGLINKTNHTNIPGVLPLAKGASTDEYYKWYQKVEDDLEAAKSAGEIPAEHPTDIYFIGVMLGYPDHAIRDFAQYYLERDQGIEPQKEIVTVDINNLAGFQFKAADPGFLIYPEHLDGPEVLKYINTSVNTLKEFYDSDWYKTTSSSLDFLEARAKSEKVKSDKLAARKKSI